MDDVRWALTDEGTPWTSDLVLDGGTILGEVFLSEVTTSGQEKNLNNTTVHVELDDTTPFISLPLVTKGSTLSVVGNATVDTAFVLQGHINSDTEVITPTTQGAQVSIETTPLPPAVIASDTLYLYLGPTALEIYYNNSAGQLVSVAFSTVNEVI